MTRAIDKLLARTRPDAAGERFAAGPAPMAGEPPLYQPMLAVVVSASADGDNRWTYSCRRAHKTAAGYGAASWTASGDAFTARNLAEVINAATGTQGNGVDAANLDTDDATFALQPIPAGAVVWVMRIAVHAASLAGEYWILAGGVPNGVDGGCD